MLCEGTDEQTDWLVYYSRVCTLGGIVPQEKKVCLEIISSFVLGYLIIPWKDSKTGSLWLLTAGVKKQQVTGSWKSVTLHLSWGISRLQVRLLTFFWAAWILKSACCFPLFIYSWNISLILVSSHGWKEHYSKFKLSMPSSFLCYCYLPLKTCGSLFFWNDLCDF